MQPLALEWTVLGAGHGSELDAAMVVVLALAGIGSALVLAGALAALVRRRSRSYLLVTLALATLLARTAFAALSLAGSVEAGAHHVLEHGLDVAMAALVIAAVYDARSARRTTGGDGVE